MNLSSGVEASEQVLCADAACCTIRCLLHAACSVQRCLLHAEFSLLCCEIPPSMLHFSQLAACCLLHAECRTFRCLALLGETGPSSGRDQRMDGNNEKCASLKRSAQHAVKMQSACYRKCSARAIGTLCRYSMLHFHCLLHASCMLRACSQSAHRLPHDTCCVHTCSMLHAA